MVNVNIQKIGDELLTAFVNEEYEKVTQIWDQADLGWISTMALHRYSNPNISSESASLALLKAIEWMRENDPIWIAREEEMEKVRAEIAEAEHKLRSLGYDNYFCEVTGITYWRQISESTARRFNDCDYDDAREVLNSLNRA